MKPFPVSSIRLVLAVLATFVLTHIAAAQAPTLPSLTPEQWRADIRFFGDELPRRHPNLFKWMKRSDFEAAVNGLYDRAASASNEENLVGLMRIVTMTQDGHTTLIPPSLFEAKVYPVRFYAFSDGLFIQRASPDHKDLAGIRVVKVGDLSAEDAMKLVKTVSFGDNEMFRLEYAPIFMSIPEILAGLHINSDKQNLKLVVESNGKQLTVELKPTATFGETFQPPAAWADAATGAVPLYRKDRANAYWFEYLKDSKVLYVQQNQVLNKDSESIADFYRRVFEFVGANPVDKFVLDLRFNNGGNNGLNRQVVIDIIKSKIDVRGKLFVITGRRTFSAAQNFANELEKYTQAIFVGEPTAGHPNHFGDAVPFVLPNSKFEIHTSTIWWQDVDPRDPRVWTAPEIAAEMSSEDYRVGRDPAMQAVLEYAPGSSFREIMASAADKSLADLARSYREFKADPRHKYVQTEADVNRFGYVLLNQKRVGDAIEVFKLNAESYPNSANVYDSLGDAYQAAGRKDDAIKAYEKALSIDPTYTSSRENLKKLRGQ